MELNYALAYLQLALGALIVAEVLAWRKRP